MKQEFGGEGFTRTTSLISQVLGVTERVLSPDEAIVEKAHPDLIDGCAANRTDLDRKEPGEYLLGSRVFSQ